MRLLVEPVQVLDNLLSRSIKVHTSIDETVAISGQVLGLTVSGSHPRAPVFTPLELRLRRAMKFRFSVNSYLSYAWALGTANVSRDGRRRGWRSFDLAA